MERRNINPWTWSQQHGYNQANEVIAADRTLYVSGQTSVDGDGEPVHVGDMSGQIHQVIDNVEAVLAAADMTPKNIVKIQFLTTDMDLFNQHARELGRLTEAGSRHTSTLVGVSRLAYPELLVEIEVTAVA